MRIIFYSGLSLLLFSCGGEKSAHETSDSIIQDNIQVDTVSEEASVVETDTFPMEYPNVQDTLYSYKITQDENGYGYEIYSQGKLMIRQPHIPAVEGNRGFAGEKDASAVAVFVIEKLKKGISPPSVTQDELIDLGVVFPIKK